MSQPKIVSPAEARVNEANRVPMGVRRLKLESIKIPGYFTRVFNDDPQGRINDALKGGWQFITEAEAMGQVTSNIDAPTAELGERVARVVGTNKQGQPIIGYQMKIKLEWYDADQAGKAKAVAESDRQIREGQVGSQQGDGRYASEISYNPRRAR